MNNATVYSFMKHDIDVSSVNRYINIEETGMKIPQIVMILKMEAAITSSFHFYITILGYINSVLFMIR